MMSLQPVIHHSPMLLSLNVGENEKGRRKTGREVGRRNLETLVNPTAHTNVSLIEKQA